jgi:rhodanese-related sulfurtransferase
MANIAPERIAIPDLQKKIETAKTLMIVDVRTPAEIQASGAVPNAVHIPVDQVDQHIGDFPKTGEVVFYCGGGGRASRAAQTLWDAGHRKVFYFGMRDWKKRNLPTAKTAQAPPGKK